MSKHLLCLFTLSVLLNGIFAQQKKCQFEKQSVYIPLVDRQKPSEVLLYPISSKNLLLQFCIYSNQPYLKIIFSAEKDTVKTQPIEKFKSEIEIKSGTKVYYKKDWAIYQENNQLFFVLLLPANYIKTLLSDGITDILIDNKFSFTLSKKETKEIKAIANCLINIK